MRTIHISPHFINIHSDIYIYNTSFIYDLLIHKITFYNILEIGKPEILYISPYIFLHVLAWLFIPKKSQCPTIKRIVEEKSHTGLLINLRINHADNNLVYESLKISFLYCVIRKIAYVQVRRCIQNIYFSLCALDVENIIKGNIFILKLTSMVPDVA